MTPGPKALLIHQMLCAHAERYGLNGAVVVTFDAYIRRRIIDEMKPLDAMVIDYEAPLFVDSVPVVARNPEACPTWPVHAPMYVVSQVQRTPESWAWIPGEGVLGP